MNQLTSLKPQPNPIRCNPNRGWVRWSSDESIAAGQFSKLAVLEIPCAMALYWYLASVSPWPWLTLIGSMAAPLLLLRSEQSIEAGLELLQKYANRKGTHSSKQRWTRFVIWLILSAYLGYWLASYWLPGITGWMFLGRCVLLGALALTLGIAIVSVFSSGVYQDTEALAKANQRIFKKLTARKLADVQSYMRAHPGAYLRIAIHIADYWLLSQRYIVATYITDAIVRLVTVGVPFGAFIRFTVIRIWVTLRCFRSGMAAFSFNFLA